MSFSVGNTLNTPSGQDYDDDVISYCGSLSGETFSSSRKRKNTCTLLQHNIDEINQKLKRQSILSTFNDNKQDKHHHHDSLGTSNIPRYNTCFHRYRIVVVMLGGFGFGLMLLLRYNITVSIIHMVNQTALYLDEHPNRTVDDFLAEGYKLGGEFDWNNEIQQMLMSWYMICYTLPQLPLTKLALYMGGRWATFISLMLCSISTLLTPWAAYMGWEWVLVLRLFNGIGASAILPMLLTLIENWMPYDEISLGLSAAQLVQALLSASSPILTGYLAAINWKYSFYIPGGITVLFSFLWLFLVTDRPDENMFTSVQELERICGCAKNNNDNDQNKNTKIKDDSMNGSNSKAKIRGTWIDVLKSPVFYSYVILAIFHCNAYNNFLFILPTYLRQFLKIGVSLNGTYCSMIQAGSIIAMIWPHPFLRVLQTRYNLSLTVSRRINFAFMSLVAGLTWAYVGVYHQMQLVMLFINRSFHNSNDILLTGALMSNFAKAELSSIAFSMVNTVGNFSVIFGSTFIGYVLDYTSQSLQAWTYIFIALALSQVVNLSLFCTVINSKPIELKRKCPDIEVGEGNQMAKKKQQKKLEEL